MTDEKTKQINISRTNIVFYLFHQILRKQVLCSCDALGIFSRKIERRHAKIRCFSDTTTLGWLVTMAPWSSDLVIQNGAGTCTLEFQPEKTCLPNPKRTLKD